jgi:hypothetical protein
LCAGHDSTKFGKVGVEQTNGSDSGKKMGIEENKGWFLLRMKGFRNTELAGGWDGGRVSFGIGFGRCETK